MFFYPFYPSLHLFHLRGGPGTSKTTSVPQMIMALQLCEHLLSDTIDSLADQASGLTRVELADAGPAGIVQGELYGPGKSVWDWLTGRFRSSDLINDLKAVLDK